MKQNKTAQTFRKQTQNKNTQNTKKGLRQNKNKYLWNKTETKKILKQTKTDSKHNMFNKQIYTPHKNKKNYMLMKQNKN